MRMPEKRSNTRHVSYRAPVKSCPLTQTAEMSFRHASDRCVQHFNFVVVPPTKFFEGDEARK